MASGWGNSGNSYRHFFFFFGGSKITADSDCSHEIFKRRLLLGRKVMTKVDGILKSRDITLPTKFRLVKAMVLPVVMYGCEGWTIKKAELWRIDAFELWCWRRLLRVPWTARRSCQGMFNFKGSNMFFFCVLFLKDSLFLISSWKTGASRDTCSSQDWDNEKGHLLGLPSVTFYLDIIYSVMPLLTQDIECFLALWRLLFVFAQCFFFFLLLPKAALYEDI